MFDLKIITVFLLTVASSAFALKVCGLEHVKRCQPNDSCCMTNEFEPALRKWLAKGRPEYFINHAIDPLCLPSLTVKFNGYVLEFKNVVITGLAGEETHVEKYSFSFEKRLMTKLYTLNLGISSESYCLTDAKGNSVDHCEPFKAKLNGIKGEVNYDLTFVDRCDGSRYLSMAANVVSTDVADCQLEVSSGKPSLCPEDEAALKEAMAKAMILKSIEKLCEGYNGFSTRVEMNEYFILKKKCKN